MNFFRRLFGIVSASDRHTEPIDKDMKKFLIACLGNIGPDYEGRGGVHVMPVR